MRRAWPTRPDKIRLGRQCFHGQNVRAVNMPARAKITSSVLTAMDPVDPRTVMRRANTGERSGISMRLRWAASAVWMSSEQRIEMKRKNCNLKRDKRGQSRIDAVEHAAMAGISPRCP